jgi:hypothetical protein
VITNTYFNHNWQGSQLDGLKITGVRGTWTTSSQTLKTVTLSAHESAVGQGPWSHTYGPVTAPKPTVSGGVKTYTLYHSFTFSTLISNLAVAWGKASAALATGKTSSCQTGISNSTDISDAPIWRIYGPASSETGYGKVDMVNGRDYFQFGVNDGGIAGTLQPAQVSLVYDATDYAASKRSTVGTVTVYLWYQGNNAKTGRPLNWDETLQISASSFTKTTSADGKTTHYVHNIDVSGFPGLMTDSSENLLEFGVRCDASVIDASKKIAAKLVHSEVDLMASS